MAEDGQRRPLAARLLRLIGGLLLAAGFFVLTAFLSAPPEAEEPQPLLTASPALVLTDAEQLEQLAERFPAPVLVCRGLRLTGGTSADTAWEGGFGRVAVLSWETSDGAEVTTRTVYPARAVRLLPSEGWRLCTGQWESLAGLPCVAMESGGRVRVHAQGTSALYAVEFPAGLEGVLSTLALR